MALPKWKWTEQAPGIENKWADMRDKVRIQRPKGTIDAAGGTPLKGQEYWEDCVVGHDGNGVSAEITPPTAEDNLLARFVQALERDDLGVELLGVIPFAGVVKDVEGFAAQLVQDENVI